MAVLAVKTHRFEDMSRYADVSMAQTAGKQAISVAFVRPSVHLSVCLSVCSSVAYIANNSRTQI